MAFQAGRIGTAVRPESVLRPGIGAGLWAGLLMILFVCIVSAVQGLGFWQPFGAIAASLLGVDALVDGFGATILGALLHFAVSALWGVGFASLVRRATPFSSAAWGGLLYGACVWAIMTFIVVPGVDATLRARVALYPVWWLGGHLIFGALLGGAPLFERQVGIPEPAERAV